MNLDELFPPEDDPGPQPEMFPCCARCYDGAFDPVILVTAPCAEEPEKLLGAPLGMYHCPDCGAMVLAGVPHPPLCLPCATGCHPSFDPPQQPQQ